MCTAQDGNYVLSHAQRGHGEYTDADVYSFLESKGAYLTGPPSPSHPPGYKFPPSPPPLLPPSPLPPPDYSLIEASKDGDLDRVQELLYAGDVDIDTRDEVSLFNFAVTDICLCALKRPETKHPAYFYGTSVCEWL